MFMYRSYQSLSPVLQAIKAMSQYNIIKRSAPLVCKTLLATVLFSQGSLSTAAEICVTSESDPDGDGYGWEQEATCLVTAETDKTPVFYDPRSGEQRVIQRIKWVTADFTNQSFKDCGGYLVDPDKRKDQCLSCDSEEEIKYQHFEDGNGRMKYSYGEIKFEAEFLWGIDDYGFYHGPMPITGYAEITENGVRQWLEGKPGEIGFYQQCDGLLPSAMIAEVPEVKPEDKSEVTSETKSTN